MTDTTTQAAPRLLELTAPARRWYVMTPDESAYCIGFSYKHEADAWMRDQADYVARNGYVLREHAWPGEKHKLAQTLHDAIASLTAERDELQAQVEALRADAAETSLALEDLIAVGSGRLQHDFVSLCPDHMTGHESRDNGCMACKALIRAQTLINNARKEGD